MFQHLGEPKLTPGYKTTSIVSRGQHKSTCPSRLASPVGSAQPAGTFRSVRKLPTRPEACWLLPSSCRGQITSLLTQLFVLSPNRINPHLRCRLLFDSHALTPLCGPIIVASVLVHWRHRCLGTTPSRAAVHRREVRGCASSHVSRSHVALRVSPCPLHDAGRLWATLTASGAALHHTRC